jgi:hypothetical protein
MEEGIEIISADVGQHLIDRDSGGELGHDGPEVLVKQGIIHAHTLVRQGNGDKKVNEDIHRNDGPAYPGRVMPRIRAVSDGDEHISLLLPLADI